MKVSLVSVTTPALDVLDPESAKIKTAEDLIVYCARVSSPNQTKTETAPRLIRYLIDHKHWSPFEMADLCVEVVTSRAISAQILRHWSISVQEFSQRYATADMGFEVYPARLQGEKNRQAGGAPEDVPAEVKAWWKEIQENHYFSANYLYERALEKGIAKEVARMLLPMATRTRMYLKGDVRSWIFYLLARTAPEAQYEHRQIAQGVLAIFREQFPCIAETVFGKP